MLQYQRIQSENQSCSINNVSQYGILYFWLFGLILYLETPHYSILSLKKTNQINQQITHPITWLILQAVLSLIYGNILENSAFLHFLHSRTNSQNFSFIFLLTPSSLSNSIPHSFIYSSHRSYFSANFCIFVFSNYFYRTEQTYLVQPLFLSKVILAIEFMTSTCYSSVRKFRHCFRLAFQISGSSFGMFLATAMMQRKPLRIGEMERASSMTLWMRQARSGVTVKPAYSLSQQWRTQRYCIFMEVMAQRQTQPILVRSFWRKRDSGVQSRMDL